MRGRILPLAVLVGAFLTVAAGNQTHGIAAVRSPRASPCGPVAAGREIIEPPNVEIWDAPLDASGEHELILGVHHDGDRFCYRYTWNGVVHTTAPTIRVRRGERFAIRIADDLVNQSRGESVASTALPPCKPMYMPNAPVQHWVGYLNHTIDDRYISMPATDTNLHLHGFEGPASMENVFLSTLSTPMHACEYDVTIPRTQPPGIYLYHPHSHGSASVEVAGGLDGAWIVEPDTLQISRAAEHVLVLRYRVPFENDNNFQPNEDAFGPPTAAHEAALRPVPPARYNPFDPPPWPMTFPMNEGGIRSDPTGCNGLASETVVSVDGAETPALLVVPAGQPQLFRIVNGTSDSAKLLRMRDAQGNRVAMHVVGLDGVPVSGDMEHPLAHYIAFNELMLSPMSRADILLTAPAGATYTLSSEHYCQGIDSFYQMHHDLLNVGAVSSAAEDGARAIASTPVVMADTPAARMVAFARAHPARVHRRAITFTEYYFGKRGRVPAHAAYYITDTTNPNFHEHPFWPLYRAGAAFPSNPDIVVKQGTIEEWYLINATMETHAFHIHQMAFVQEHSSMGVPITVDTVFVPLGRLLPNRRDPNYPLIQPSITRVILDFRHVPKGEFVFHCHMLYHEDRGMMGVIRVE